MNLNYFEPIGIWVILDFDYTSSSQSQSCGLNWVKVCSGKVTLQLNICVPQEINLSKPIHKVFGLFKCVKSLKSHHLKLVKKVTHILTQLQYCELPIYGCIDPSIYPSMQLYVCLSKEKHQVWPDCGVSGLGEVQWTWSTQGADHRLNNCNHIKVKALGFNI